MSWNLAWHDAGNWRNVLTACALFRQFTAHGDGHSHTQIHSSKWQPKFFLMGEYVQYYTHLGSSVLMIAGTLRMGVLCAPSHMGLVCWLFGGELSAMWILTSLCHFTTISTFVLPSELNLILVLIWDLQPDCQQNGTTLTMWFSIFFVELTMFFCTVLVTI